MMKADAYFMILKFIEETKSLDDRLTCDQSRNFCPCGLCVNVKKSVYANPDTRDTID